MDLDTYAVKGQYVTAKLAVAQLKNNAYPAKILTKVPQCQLDMRVSKEVPDDRAIPMHIGGQEVGTWITRGQGGVASCRPFNEV